MIGLLAGQGSVLGYDSNQLEFPDLNKNALSPHDATEHRLERRAPMTNGEQMNESLQRMRSALIRQRRQEQQAGQGYSQSFFQNLAHFHQRRLEAGHPGLPEAITQRFPRAQQQGQQQQQTLLGRRRGRNEVGGGSAREAEPQQPPLRRQRASANDHGQTPTQGPFHNAHPPFQPGQPARHPSGHFDQQNLHNLQSPAQLNIRVDSTHHGHLSRQHSASVQPHTPSLHHNQPSRQQSVHFPSPLRGPSENHPHPFPSPQRGPFQFHPQEPQGPPHAIFNPPRHESFNDPRRTPPGHGGSHEPLQPPRQGSSVSSWTPPPPSPPTPQGRLGHRAPPLPPLPPTRGVGGGHELRKAHSI